jgi:hypothetical protein
LPILENLGRFRNGGGRATAGPAYLDLVSDVAVIPAKKSRDLYY